MNRRNIGPHLISAGGAAIILLALYLHWRYGYDLELIVLGIGGFFLWYGGFLADRKASIEGGTFIVDSLVKLGGVFRLTSARADGQRAEDKSPIPTVVVPAQQSTPTTDVDARKP